MNFSLLEITNPVNFAGLFRKARGVSQRKSIRLLYTRVCWYSTHGGCSCWRRGIQEAQREKPT